MAPSIIQGSFGPHDPSEDGWKVYLRNEFPDLWVRSLEVAHNRLGWHERRRTHQTSNRDKLPRHLPEEWFHLMGEAALWVLLYRRGVPVGELNWYDTSAGAREQSRHGNVIPGVSVYVPKVDNGGLIIRKDEAEQTPDLIFVLMRLKRFGTPQEYLKAYGWRRAAEGWRIGTNFGHQGTPLRDPGDRLVPRVHGLDYLIGEIP